jgi:hypothetical protein
MFGVRPVTPSVGLRLRAGGSDVNGDQALRQGDFDWPGPDESEQATQNFDQH